MSFANGDNNDDNDTGNGKENTGHFSLWHVTCDNVNFSMIGTSFLPVMRTNGTDTSHGGGGGDDDGGGHRVHDNNNKFKHSGSMQTLTKSELSHLDRRKSVLCCMYSIFIFKLIFESNIKDFQQKLEKTFWHTYFDWITMIPYYI